MLKSRLLAGGALILACAVVLPAFAHTTSISSTQNKSDTAAVLTEGLEYAMVLSADDFSADASKLNNGNAAHPVSLPKTSGALQDVGSASISFNDPEIQRQIDEQAARELETNYLTFDEDKNDEEFVFDISKTIFPVTEEEVEMLKYVVEAEAGGGTIEAKRIVTFSITNRVLSSTFPDTLYEVLHSINQFSTIRNYYNKRKVPSESTCRAVEEVLMGVCEDNSQNCMYFYCTNYPIEQWIIDWFEEDLVYLYTVGCDRFFTDPT